MIVQPFRPNRPDADVYHTNSLCQAGKAIEPNDRLSGAGGLSECDKCLNLIGSRFALDGVEESLRNDLGVLAHAETLGGFGIIIRLADSDELLLTEGAYEIFGITPSKDLIPNDRVLGTIHPDDHARVIEGLTAISEGIDYDIRRRIVRADGTIRWAQTRGTLVKQTASHPEYLLATIVDITDYLEPQVDAE